MKGMTINYLPTSCCLSLSCHNSPSGELEVNFGRCLQLGDLNELVVRMSLLNGTGAKYDGRNATGVGPGSVRSKRNPNRLMSAFNSLDGLQQLAR